MLSEASSKLAAAGIETAYMDATVLLAYVLGTKRERILLGQDEKMGNDKINKFNMLIERRCKKEPIAYITGKKEFWSLDFTVTPDTLIPRPDSETLVEAALVRAKKIAGELNKPLALLNINLLDIGTGTACLLIALLKELPAACGTGVDISDPALKVAEHNAEHNHVSKRVRFMNSNWCDAVEGKFDLVISNPPYIARGDFAHLMKDVAAYEPVLALVAGEDGLDAYRMLARQVSSRLNAGGYALFETGRGQAEKVAALLEENGLTIDGIENDLAGIPRCVVAKKATH